jgi:mRNA-degrading endonuclease toxin of MazEF toxin-antitoxin module
MSPKDVPVKEPPAREPERKEPHLRLLRSTNLRDQTTGTSACGICTRQPSPLRPMVPVKPEGLDHTGLHLPGRRR